MILGGAKLLQKSTVMTFKRSFSQVLSEIPVLKENSSNVCKITLNRPTVLNSFDQNTLDNFHKIINEAEQDPNIQAIILKGKGRAFSSGGDLKFILSIINNDNTISPAFRKYVAGCFNQIYINASLQTTLITFMDGITMGLGAGVSMYSPFRIVNENTKYAMPETVIGMFCDGLSTHYLSRFDVNLAKYITMTGTMLKGEDTLFAGIGTHFVPSSCLDELEEHLSKETQLNHQRINRIIQDYSVNESHIPKSHVLNPENNAIIQKCFKFNNVIDIIKALEENGSDFASNAIDAILKGSPTCTTVNVENLNRSPNMTFSELVEMERELWYRISALHDFSEGVQSNLILKKAPKWNPATIKDVNMDFLRQNIYRDGQAIDRTVQYSYDPFTPMNLLKYALPTRANVLQAQKENNLTTLEDTIQWFQAKAGNKFGIRQKIESMVSI